MHCLPGRLPDVPSHLNVARLRAGPASQGWERNFAPPLDGLNYIVRRWRLNIYCPSLEERCGFREQQDSPSLFCPHYRSLPLVWPPSCSVIRNGAHTWKSVSSVLKSIRGHGGAMSLLATLDTSNSCFLVALVRVGHFWVIPGFGTERTGMKRSSLVPPPAAFLQLPTTKRGNPSSCMVAGGMTE